MTSVPAPRIKTTLSCAEQPGWKRLGQCPATLPGNCKFHVTTFVRHHLPAPNRPAAKDEDFRNRVVRSIPSHSLNSAIPHPSLACNAPKIGVCVGRTPYRRTSVSKNCVITRDVRRTLKHAQCSTDVMSNCFFILCIYTTIAILSIDFLTHTKPDRKMPARSVIKPISSTAHPRPIS